MTPPLPTLTADTPDFQAVMDAAFAQVAFEDPDGLEPPGDVLGSVRDALKDRYYVSTRLLRRYLRARGVYDFHVPELGRRFYVGVVLRHPYEAA